MPISKIVLDNQSKENVDLDGQYVRVPHGTTAQRPSNPAAGYLRFNTTLGTLEQWNTNTNNWAAIDSPPIISSLAYSGSNTATDPAGGETITLTGSNFKSGFTITVGGTTAPTTTFVDSTTVRFTTPAKTAGDYDVVFTNANGLAATLTAGISYNGIPSFTTAAGNVGSVFEDEEMSTITIVAAEPDSGTVSFSVTSGALPTGVTLASGGAITGTPNVNVTADTTYNFTVTATDDESQTTDRAFNLIVVRPVYIKTIDAAIKHGWSSTTNNLNRTLSTSYTTWTLSLWLKKWHDNQNNASHSQYIWNTTGGSQGVLIDPRGSSAISARGAILPYDSNGRGTASEMRILDGNWTHVVLSCNNGSESLYVNGVLDTAYDTAGATRADALSGTLRIGNWSNDAYMFTGGLAEIHFVSGTAYDATTFGQVYNDTWIPKEVTLTTAQYGADGFHLDFADSTNKGNDVSGNNNDLTFQNTDTTDYMKHDTPTKDAMRLQDYSGNANYLYNKWGAYLYSRYNGGNYQYAHGQFSLPSSGKWYFEVRHYEHTGSGNFSLAGIIAESNMRSMAFKTSTRIDSVTGNEFYGIAIDSYSNTYQYKLGDGQTNPSSVSWTYDANDWWGCAVDLDNGKMWWSKNGTWLDGDPVAGTGAPITWTPNDNSAYKTNGNEQKERRWYPLGMVTRSSDSTNGSRLIFNFGWIGGGVAEHTGYELDGFKYSPPTGFNRMARNLLPDQTAFSPKHSNHPSDHFGVATYRGDGTTDNSKSVTTTCQPDMVWIKGRENSAYFWRAFTPTLKSGNDHIPYFFGTVTQAADFATNDSIQVSSNAFTLGDVTSAGSGEARGGINRNAEDMLAIYWKLGGNPVTNPNGSISSTISVNTTTQISNTLHTATNAAGTLGHGLNGKPDVAIISETGGGTNYNIWMWSRKLSGDSGGAGFWSGLNTTAAWDSTPTTFPAGVTDTTVGWTGSGQYGNQSGQFNITFFKEVPGFSKFGFYMGNQFNENPPEVKLGFRPKMVMIKAYNQNPSNWLIWTDQQDTVLNERPLYLNLGNSESTETARALYFLSDGFRVNNYASWNQDLNKDTYSYFYMAFAAHPTEYSFTGMFSDFSTSQNLTA